MAGFVKGDVVVLPFPFSDLSANKRRPALVLADLSGKAIILYKIGNVKPVKFQQVRDKIVEILDR